MKRGIMTAGAGWISSGLICIAVWLVERGFENAQGIFFTGLIVIIVGTWLLLLNKKIEKMADQIRAKSKRAAAK